MELTLKTQWIARLKLWAEGDKLRAEGGKLRAEGDKLWAEAILEVKGNITLEWQWRGNVLDCHLEGGEIYLGDMQIEHESAT